MTQRTSTPEIDQIWSRPETIRRWHRIWRETLQLQAAHNPGHPGVTEQDWVNFELVDYGLRDPAAMAAHLCRVDELERTTRHELQAALYAYVEAAGADSVHMGLTSADVTDPANQVAILESLRVIVIHATALARDLTDNMRNTAGHKLVARTHGRPAQLTTIGHRYATVLGPLLDWLDRAEHTLRRYSMRPQRGAVGTGADLSRVLAGWQDDGGASETPLEATGSASEGSGGIKAPPGASEGGEWLRGGDRQQYRLFKLALTAAVERHLEERGLTRDEVAQELRETAAVMWPEAAKVYREVAEELLAQVTEGQPTLTSDLNCRDTTAESDGESVSEEWDGLIQINRPPGPPLPSPGSQGCLVSAPPPPIRSQSMSDGQVRTGSNIDKDQHSDMDIDPWILDRRYQSDMDIDPWILDRRYQSELGATLGFGVTMSVTRQVYHRSYDLDVAGLLNQLASIAQTYATDRRLEAMLGLGNEVYRSGQVGSSAMPHKVNPRIAERICSLAVIARGDLVVCAELSGMDWLEGDVSTSAARRLVLPRMFQNIDAILSNWWWLNRNWVWDHSFREIEIDLNVHQMATGALLQAAIEAGASRQKAHAAIMKAGSGPGGWGLWLDTLCPFRARLGQDPDFPLNAQQIRGVIAEFLTNPRVGLAQEQIERLERRVRLLPHTSWEPEEPK